MRFFELLGVLYPGGMAEISRWLSEATPPDFSEEEYNPVGGRSQICDPLRGRGWRAD
jgi:hypothetical protein